MKTFLGALCIVVLTTGCFTPTKEMQSFIGHPAADVAAAWGQPSSIMPDGNGGQVWIYTGERTFTTPGQVNTTAAAYGTTTGQFTPNYSGIGYQANSYAAGSATTTYTPPQQTTYQTIRSFYVSPDGIITGYRWKGL
jgi:hypothetical protein